MDDDAVEKLVQQHQQGNAAATAGLAAAGISLSDGPQGVAWTRDSAEHQSRPHHEVTATGVTFMATTEEAAKAAIDEGGTAVGNVYVPLGATLRVQPA